MYATSISPWQTVGFIPQQQYITTQPVQTFQNMGYSQPYGSAMFSPVGNIQTGFIPQGAISYGYSPGWGWGQTANPVIGGQFVHMVPQMQGRCRCSRVNNRHQSGFGLSQPRIELAETSNDVIVTLIYRM